MSQTDLLNRYITAKEAHTKASLELRGAEQALIKEMEETQQKSFSYESGMRVTYVKQTRYNIDEKGLRRALKARVFDRYTVRKLDRKALEKALGDGDVDPVVVSRYVSEVEGTPFLKFTDVKDNL